MRCYIYYHKFHKGMHSDQLVLTALHDYLRKIGQEDSIPTGEVSIPVEELNIQTEGIIVRDGIHKKPYFAEYPSIFFNVSHSGDWWCCAFSSVENGLDLQKTTAKSLEKLAHRYMHPDEIAWLEGKSSDQYYRLWAYNESYVKFTGDGLTKGLSYFSVIPTGSTSSKACNYACDHSNPPLCNTIDLEPGIKNSTVFQQEIPFPDSAYWLVLTTPKPVDVTLIPLDPCI